jgi:hypothetical protein
MRSRHQDEATHNTGVPTHPHRSRPYETTPLPSSFLSSFVLHLTLLGRNELRPYITLCFFEMYWSLWLPPVLL